MPSSIPPRVALCRGDERAANLRRAIGLVADEIPWSARRAVLIKPNLVAAEHPIAITHRDALEVVLDEVRKRYDGHLTIAEGCAIRSTREVFAEQDYPKLAAYYHAELLDLNADATEPVLVYRHDARALRLRLARSVLASDCRISLTIPKTHDTVLVTLSIKNMIMGTLVNRRLTDRADHVGWRDRVGRAIYGNGDGWGSDKSAMHQSYPMININLALLAPLVLPHLSVVDGFVAMEGEGPIRGTPVPWKIAVAGTDPLAVDTLTASLMGFEPGSVGYLRYCADNQLGCADPARMELVGGADAEAIARRFVPHPRHVDQRSWGHPQAGRLLMQVTPGLL